MACDNCQFGCYGGCDNTCNGCSGCGPCGPCEGCYGCDGCDGCGGCDGGCSSCGGCDNTCRNGCNTTCNTTCKDNCKDTCKNFCNTACTNQTNLNAISNLLNLIKRGDYVLQAPFLQIRQYTDEELRRRGKTVPSYSGISGYCIYNNLTQLIRDLNTINSGLANPSQIPTYDDIYAILNKLKTHMSTVIPKP